MLESVITYMTGGAGYNHLSFELLPGIARIRMVLSYVRCGLMRFDWVAKASSSMRSLLVCGCHHILNLQGLHRIQCAKA